MKLLHAASEIILVLTAILLSFPSCSVKKSGIHELNEGTSLIYYPGLHYNDFGVPVFRDALKERPVDAGKQYLAVILSADLPVRYYNIGIFNTDEKPDYSRPFRIIHQWTGRGFELGYENSRDLIDNSAKLAGKTKVKEYSALLAGPGMAVGGAIFIATGVGGFAVGVHESLYASIEEFQKLGIRKREVVLGFTTIEHDKLRRISRYITFSPPPEEVKLSETRFYYIGEETTPRKTVNYSYPEKKTRTVYSRN